MFDDIEFPGPILVFDKRRLGEALDELYKSDYYPMSFVEDNRNELLINFRAEFPKQNIDCIIIPVRYLTTFLA